MQVAVVVLTLEPRPSSIVEDLVVASVQIEMAGPVAEKVTMASLQRALQAAVEDLGERLDP